MSDREPLEVPVDAVVKEDARRLGALIDACKDTIAQRWLERIVADLGETPDVAITELRDGMPDYLTALVEVLHRTSREQVLLGAHEAWKKVAREHGVTRVRCGFDIGQLVHEFVVLRGVLRELARERRVDSVGVEALLADLLDAAIGEAVQSYVDARDYEARREQAENVAFLTHELKNPLSAAMLAASSLRQSVPDHERLLDVLERNHARLSALIHGVLLNQQLESHKPESRPIEITLGELLEPALEAAREQARHKGIAFRAHFDPALRVFADPALTRSAVQNLVDNGVKYTDAGHVDVNVENKPDVLQIHVRDTCHGISSEELRTIFEPFRRGRTRQAGTGLGLAITRRAVEVQGGSVHAESPEPQGCHFWIDLPKRRSA